MKEQEKLKEEEAPEKLFPTLVLNFVVSLFSVRRGTSFSRRGDALMRKKPHHPVPLMLSPVLQVLQTGDDDNDDDGERKRDGFCTGYSHLEVRVYKRKHIVVTDEEDEGRGSNKLSPGLLGLHSLVDN